MIRKVGIVALLFIALLAAAPAGSPARLSYVYSDSMEPTLEVNDGYLLIPSDGVETGEVVTFYSSEHGEYVTHRVVGESRRGLITKGDNNAATDQASGHPHVPREEVVGELLTVGGEPVVVPGFGNAVTVVRGHRLVLLGALGLLLVVGGIRPGRANAARERSVPRIRDVFLPLFLVALLSTTGLVFLGGHAEQVRVVTVEGGSSSPNVVDIGEPYTTTVRVNRSASAFTDTVVGARGGNLSDRRHNGTAITAKLRVPPRQETGPQTASVLVHRYPAVLPRGALGWLHDVHPLVPAGATTAIVSLPLYLVYLIAFDGATPVRPSRRRWLHGLEEGER